MLARKSRCFEFYITKKSVFAFSSLKHARLSFIAQKTCFGLFAVILGCFRCYCTKKWFSSIMQESPWFSLDFTQTTVFLSFGWVTLSQNRLSENKLVLSLLCFLFHNQTSLWRLYITGKMFWLVANILRLPWALRHTKKKSFSALLCFKYVAFSSIAGKRFYGLFAVKLGCFQRYSTRKMFSSSLQWVTLIFTWFYLKQRFCLFSNKLHCF